MMVCITGIELLVVPVRRASWPAGLAGQDVYLPASFHEYPEIPNMTN